jgi:hypothetical protein
MGQNVQKPSTLGIIVKILAIIIPVLGAIAVAYFQFYLPEKLKIETTQTAEARFTIAALSATPLPTSTDIPTATLTLLPTFTITLTSSSTPTNTPPPLPLVEVFPQAVNGQKFAFVNGTGTVVDKFVPAPQACVHSGPYGLQLTYDVTGSGNGGWGVQWVSSTAGHFDASGFTAFNFWIKGTNGGETFQVGLKDTTGKEVKVESIDSVVVTSDWVLISFPLRLFNGVNTALIENVNFGFNKNHGSGSFCLDDISFAP